MPPPPELDKRTLPDILAQCEALAGLYTPDWTGATVAADPGRALIEVFARLYELLLDRYNRIPEKNFISFLDLVGVEQFPGRPAEAPVTFLLSKQATAGGFIPAGAQVATTQTETADARIFETRRSFFATPAKLQSIVNVVPPADAFSGIALPPLPPAAADVAPDVSRAVPSLVPGAALLQPIEHVLYVGSAALFGRKEAVDASLSLTLSGSNARFAAANLEWRAFSSKTAAWIPLTPQPAYDLSQPGVVKVTFSSLSGIEKSPVDGVEDFWLAAAFIADFSAGAPPPITAVAGTIAPPGGGTASAQPDAAFTNANPLDLSKPFLPFGPRPAYGDAFYLSSAVGFAPEVGSVTLTFTIRPYSVSALQTIFKNITADTTISTTVDWQYLDNKGVWRPLQSYSHKLTAAVGNPPAITQSASGGGAGEDGTLFGANGASAVVKLTPFPSDIGLLELNGKKSYWLRALLKSDHPYGGDAFVPPGANPPVVVGPTFVPPVVEDFQISYAHRATPMAPGHLRTRNNFESLDHSPASGGQLTPFVPFVPLTAHVANGVPGAFAPEAALYFGFDAPFGQAFISLFVHLADIVSAGTFPLETGSPEIAWEYFSKARQWKPLDVADDTGDLRTSGVAGFLAPEDSDSLVLFPLLFSPAAAPSLYWYRARLKSGTYDHPPLVLGVYLNTVMADNKSTLGQLSISGQPELLIGSATGEQSQIVNLIQRPVLSGGVWVREPEVPNSLELDQLLEDFLDSEDVVSPPQTVQDLYEVRIPGAADGEPEIWVRWKRVPNFLSSLPRSRHYTLDAVSGIVTFGDNNNGLIPPAGKDSLVIRDYQTGGGEASNAVAAALAIKEVKTSLPFVDKVFNVQKAEGGSDHWSIGETLLFGPQIVKNRGRAVTTEDYESMVLQEFSQAARVRCLATRQPGPGGGLVFKPGAVTLVVVPKSTERLPEPSQRLLNEVRAFLAEKTLGNIVSDIYAIGPDYTVVRVEATVVPRKPEEASLVARRVARALEDFLHPLTGGEAGTGWEFGRDVVLSEIFAVMERTEGVDHVVSANFPDAPLQESIAVGENSLAASGVHTVHIG